MLSVLLLAPATALSVVQTGNTITLAWDAPTHNPTGYTAARGSGFGPGCR
jgi:hypothetical protein